MNNVMQLPTISPDDIDFREYLKTFKHMDDVGYADEFTDDLKAYFRKGAEVSGAKLPWAATHNDVRCRPKEVTLWLGINGHGKSELLGQACLGFLEQGEPVLIMSFEMSPVATLARMCRQAAMNSDVPDQFVDQFLQWCDGKLTLFKHTGRTSHDTLLGVIHYAAKELKVKHVVIDSLMMVTHGAAGDRAMNEQKDLVHDLCNTARNLNIHIHLVHHSRKLENEFAIPGKFDAVGTGGISDQVDQVMIVWRRKIKEKKLDALAANSEEYKAIDASMSDALLICAKNRHGSGEREYPLWRHHASRRFVGNSARKIRPLEGL